MQHKKNHNEIEKKKICCVKILLKNVNVGGRPSNSISLNCNWNHEYLEKLSIVNDWY